MIRSARWLFAAALLPLAACASNSTPVPAAASRRPRRRSRPPTRPS